MRLTRDQEGETVWRLSTACLAVFLVASCAGAPTQQAGDIPVDGIVERSHSAVASMEKPEGYGNPLKLSTNAENEPAAADVFTVSFSVPVSPSDLVTNESGTWRGYYIHDARDTRGVKPRHIYLRFDEFADGATAYALISSRMAEEEILRALAGSLPADESFMVDRFAAVQEMEVRRAGSEIEFFPLTWTPVFGSPNMGVEMTGIAVDSQDDQTLKCRTFPVIPLDRWGIQEKHADIVRSQGNEYRRGKEVSYPVVLHPGGYRAVSVNADWERGVVQELTVLDFPDITYRIVLPPGFDWSAPTIAVLNEAPWGFDASPLAAETAAKLGWISIGLPDMADGTSDEGYLLSRPDAFYTVLDVLQRFKIAGKGLIFAGFSEGAKKSAVTRAMYFRGYTGGVIDIDMGHWFTYGLEVSVPVFSMLSEDQPRSDAWIDGARRKITTEFTWGRMEMFPGGHSWGPPELHSQAMEWLATVRKDPRFAEGF